jgi:hypothetical protein
MTHEGGAPKWEIVADPSAPSKPNVLAQTSTDNTSGRFPLAIYEKATLTNGSLTVRFKTISGARDQAAGLVWRYKNPDNYYIVRANALENNVVLYKVEGGKRLSLEPKGTPSKTYGVKHQVPKQTWSTLKVSFDSARFEVFFAARGLWRSKIGRSPKQAKSASGRKPTASHISTIFRSIRRINPCAGSPAKE